MFRYCSIIILICFSVSSFALKRTFPLTNEWKTPLVSLLDEAVDLHQAVYAQKEDQVLLTLSRMVNQIETLKQSPSVLPYHQQSYMYKLLQGLKPQLEAIKTSSPGNRKNNINSVNRTLTYMAHVYGLKKYAIFFCPQDYSVWMQGKQKTKKNRPLHLDYKSCGALVNK